MLVVICISPGLVWKIYLLLSHHRRQVDSAKKIPYSPCKNLGGRDDALEWEAGERKAFTWAEERPETYPRSEPTDQT